MILYVILLIHHPQNILNIILFLLLILSRKWFLNCRLFVSTYRYWLFYCRLIEFMDLIVVEVKGIIYPVFALYNNTNDVMWALYYSNGVWYKESYTYCIGFVRWNYFLFSWRSCHCVYLCVLYSFKAERNVLWWRWKDFF